MRDGAGEEKRPQVNKRVRVALAALITLAGATTVLAIYMASLTDNSAAESDFISYWAAGHLLIHGQNPYDLQAVHALEIAAGRNPGEPVLVMRNPPVAFFMALPFAWMGPKAGVIVWMFFLLGALGLASRLIWQINGRPDTLLNFFGFAFAPSLACLMAGQCGILLLLGIALFLFLFRERPFLAGASLLLCAIKPHFFAPFGIALLIWCATTRKGYRIIAGVCVALMASCALAYAMDQHAWSQYSEMMRTGGALNEVGPRLSAELRLLIDPRAVWIQFVLRLPRAFGRSGTSGRDASHGTGWIMEWCCCWWAPCAHLTDLYTTRAMLLPAILAGAYRCIGVGKATMAPCGACSCGASGTRDGRDDCLALLLVATPAWLCWYLYATGRFRRRETAIAR